MSQWWDVREAREKLLILIAIGLSVLMLVWFGLISPLQSAKAEAQRRLDQITADKTVIDQSLGRLAQFDGVSDLPAPEFDQFRSTVTRIAQQRGLAISRLQSSSEGTLQLVFNDASSTDIFLWLEGISDEAGGKPVRADLSVRDDRLQAVIELRGTRP